MKISILWSIIGLSLLGVAQGGFRYNLRAEEESSAAPATTEPPQVNVSSTLSNYNGLNLIQNDDEKTLGFVNVTENVGISFTAHEGGDVRILLDSKTGHVVTFQRLDKVSLIQNNEFRGDVLKALDLILQNYVFKSVPISGNSSEIQSSSEDGLALWSEVFLHLGHPKEKGNVNFRHLKYVHKLSKRLKHLYLGSLKGLIVGKGPFPLKQNLNRFLTISLGLHELFSKANGGLKAILAKNVSFEVNSLFNGKNGAEVLVYILRQTGAKFDLSTLWGDILNNIDDLLDIIVKLGGGESKNGVDETFAIIGHLWAVVRLRIPVTDFINFLFESTSEDHWSQADDGDFQQVLKDIKNITDQQSKKYDNVVQLSGFVKFFTNLTANSLIENNVNISELVEKWRKRDVVGGLRTISHLFFKFFSPEKYSNIFFNSFTAFLNATSDPEAVKHLIPGVPLENISGTGGSVWNAIRKTYNIDDQLKKGGNANQILNGVPIFNEFSKIYKDALGNNFDFSKLLNGGTLSEYLSKNPFLTPFKWGVDGFSKFIHGSGDFIKHIFIDPIQHFLPSNASIIPNLPFLQPGIVLPGAATEKSSDEKEHGPTSKVEDDDDAEGKVTIEFVASSKKPSTSEEEETESESKEKQTSSEAKKSTTPASEETHLTASLSTSTSSDDDSEATKATEKTEESSKKTTETSEDKETKSSIVVKSEGSTSATTESTIELRHHHRHHVENRHHAHLSRKHHNEKHDNKQHIAHKYKHHNPENSHENKHNTRKHHQDKNNHSSRRHNHGAHQDNQQERNHQHPNHEFKHHHVARHHKEE